MRFYTWSFSTFIQPCNDHVNPDFKISKYILRVKIWHWYIQNSRSGQNRNILCYFGQTKHKKVDRNCVRTRENISWWHVSYSPPRCPPLYSSNIVTAVLNSVVTWSTKSPLADRQREGDIKTERVSRRQGWNERKVGHFQRSFITSYRISPHHWPPQTAIIHPHSPQASTHVCTYFKRMKDQRG